MKDRARYERNRAVLVLLAERWPACFSVYEGRRRQLKVGIHNDILAALDGTVAAKELGAALRVYVSNAVYRARLRAGAIRIGLDGRPAGEVTAAEAAAEPKKPRPATAAEKPTAMSASTTAMPAPTTAMPASAKRISLVGLREAARVRREGGTAMSSLAGEITVFSKGDGPLTKRISLAADGSIKSDGSACVTPSGEAPPSRRPHWMVRFQ